MFERVRKEISYLRLPGKVILGLFFIAFLFLVYWLIASLIRQVAPLGAEGELAGESTPALAEGVAEVDESVPLPTMPASFTPSPDPPQPVKSTATEVPTLPIPPSPTPVASATPMLVAPLATLSPTMESEFVSESGEEVPSPTPTDAVYCTANVIADSVSIREKAGSGPDKIFTRVLKNNSLNILSVDPIRTPEEGKQEDWVWYHVSTLDEEFVGWAPIGLIIEGNEQVCGCGISCP